MVMDSHYHYGVMATVMVVSSKMAIFDTIAMVITITIMSNTAVFGDREAQCFPTKMFRILKLPSGATDVGGIADKIPRHFSKKLSRVPLTLKSLYSM